MTRKLALDPTRSCLPEIDWPSADQKLWRAALTTGDVLEPGGERSRHRFSSNHALAGGYGRWLSFLRCHDLLDPAEPPGTRITRDRVRAYLDELAGQVALATQERRVVELRLMAELFDPTRDWRWLRHLAAQLRHRRQPSRDKRSKLVGADDVAGLGERLMQQAEADAAGIAWRRALLFRDGLVIALLACRPLRRANFAGLRLGQHMVQRGAGWWLLLSGDETKNHEPIALPLPDALLPALERYLAVWRPLLLERHSEHRHVPSAGDAVWVSANGAAMDTQALYDLTARHTRAAFGKEINPHMFRDIATTSIAIEEPEHVRIASQVLGHRHPATTERHYNLATAVEATRHWQNTLERLRASGHPGEHSRPRKDSAS